MKFKKYIGIGIFAVLAIEAVIFVTVQLQHSANAADSQSAQVKSVDSTITADGVITAQNEATLHFQTGGKLVSVPLKEGDKVYQGQTVAQLDTYDLQRQLTEALNTYKSTRNTFDQTQQNQGKNITQVNQAGQLNFYGAGLPKYGTDTTTTNYLDQVAARIVDSTQASLDTSVANVEIANYAIQMATLTSPLTGIVTHEDVNVAGQNVTPATSFVVADPTTNIFRANIPASDIDYITEGMNASIMLDGSNNKISGTIVKVYPSKVTLLPTGEEVYQVDIQSDQITASSKLDQGGTAIIMTNAENLTLVPAWTVLSGKYVWVENKGKVVLRTVTTGKVHGSQMEITGGLDSDDRVITDPKMIPSKDYPIL